MNVLSSLLKDNTYITSLDLRYNQISDRGAKVLAQIIKVRCLHLECTYESVNILSQGASFQLKATKA